MDLDEYKRLYEGKDATPGWDAINSRLAEVYGSQEPKHWGSVIKYMIGGPDPLDGISAYECQDGGVPHLHFCTYGFSSLYYDEESVGGECSRFGFEMTFRLATPLPLTEQPNWLINLLNNLARYVFKSGRWFEEYHWIPALGPIRLDYPTDLVGLAFVLDPTLEPIDTPHGRVEFIQAFGITAKELESLQSKTRTCKQIIAAHKRSNPLLITDLDRQDTDTDDCDA
ncbi:MAG: suppressor of fused domain protein [Fimbriiglobus sp.]